MESLLTTIERKALADFVVRPGGAEGAFVEKEFLCDKPDEAWLRAHRGFEFREGFPLAFAFTASKSDMRLVGTSLTVEPAEFRRCGDTFLEQEKFGRGPDPGDDDPGTIEKTQTGKPYGKGRQLNMMQSCDCAVELFLACITQELQGDVPRFGRRPA